MSAPADDTVYNSAAFGSGSSIPRAADPASQMTSSGASLAPAVHPAEFPVATPSHHSGILPLERFAEVQVEISVEIGRVTMPLGELLHLGPGSVVELNRELNEPVTVMAQGVHIASGEVVVVDDRFAVKITEIAQSAQFSRGTLSGASQ